MDYKAAVKQIQKGHFNPVYVCVGIEKYLIDQFIAFLSGQLIPSDEADFAISRYDMREAPLTACIDDAETLPFMTEKKLVVAHHASFLTAARDKVKVEHDLDRLQAYIEHPAPQTVLVFIVDAEKMDERKKVAKLIKKHEYAVNFPTMDTRSLKAWISKQGAKSGIALNDDAIEALLMNAGTDLHTLASEIEKLALFADEHQMITPEMIRQLTVRSTEQNVFLLVEEIVNRRPDAALAIYQDLLLRREEPLKLLMLVARQFRIILQAKILHAQGMPNQQIASQLKLHPYGVKVALNQGRVYNEHFLNKIIDLLAETDYQMKTGKMDKEMALELVILRTAAGVML